MRLIGMGLNATPSLPPAAVPDDGARAGEPVPDAAQAVTLLYQVNALGLVRLAYVMIGDRDCAEDIVQEAFGGLFRRWSQLSDPDKALSYLRSCVLNACRSVLRRGRPEITGAIPLDDLSLAPAPDVGEAMALREEERSMVMTALRRLPHRQREVLVLRYYLGMSETQIAAEMGVVTGTVRSATHRALAKLGQMLQETK